MDSNTEDQRSGALDLTSETKLSERIIGAAIEVHNELGGPGLLESVYEEAMVDELLSCGFEVGRQVRVPVLYKGRVLREHLQLDLLVEKTIIVELKAVSDPKPIFQSQLLTYLRLMNRKLGLLINFGLPRLVDGVSRVVNNRYAL